MTKKVFAPDTQPGIQRDGTVLDRNYYQDGQWVRFQRGRPRKIQGYQEITEFFAGPSRGVYLDPQGQFNTVFSGYNNGMQNLQINNLGVGTGVLDFTLNDFTPDDRNLWQIDSTFDSQGTNLQTLVTHPGLNLEEIANETNTPVLGGDITGTTLSAIGVFTATGTANGTNQITLDTTNSLVGAGQVVTGTNIPANTTVVSITGGTTVDLTNPAGVPISTLAITTPGSSYTNGSYTNKVLVGGTGTGATANITVAGGIVTVCTINAPGSGYVVGDILTCPSLPVGNGFTTTISAGVVTNRTFTFNNQIDVSGGVVVLHPYTFVYGNNGFIKNNSAGNLNDWVSADANETNVSSTKIVKGLPVRGGTNAPSGLFWALDSLIRVSYAPTTVSTGGVSSTFYWRYDIVSSQSSILSSQCVIEYDGIYYWVGVDRFLLYNGVVKEIPNNFNQNYFFDNLNYSQRQKVWATKVPRYGEIWWFYPHGDSTECNNAIIYNIRENCWYDAGFAEGSKRSAGYFSQVFTRPIAMDWQPNRSPSGVGALTNYLSITYHGSGYTDGIYYQLPLDDAGHIGLQAYANITVTGGVVTEVALLQKGNGYEVGQALTCPALDYYAGGSGYTTILENTDVQNLVTLYQHEIGYNAVVQNQVYAIPSYFETSNLGWVSGGPAQQSPEGANYWLRLERVEPDFVQSGDMSMYVTGRKFAQSEDDTTGPYVFSPDTGKIDLREQRRELRLKFESNVVDGDYQLGYLLLSADIGDVRP